MEFLEGILLFDCVLILLFCTLFVYTTGLFTVSDPPPNDLSTFSALTLSDLDTPTPTPKPTATTAPTATPVPTQTPTPKNTPTLEPTKAPYVFPKPIFTHEPQPLLYKAAPTRSH